MSESGGAVIRTWHDGALPHDVRAALERLAKNGDVRRIVVLPDVHLSADVCIGTVVATGHTLYPNAVGADIGCGVAAVALEGDAALLDSPQSAADVLGGLYASIPVIRHGHRAEPRLPEGLEARRLSVPRLETLKHREARRQLGTLGRGNHFVELQADETGRLWLMIHSGSRGIGQAIRDHHLARGATDRNGLRLLDAESTIGRDYLQDVAWAVDYADASRRAMAHAACEVIEGDLRGGGGGRDPAGLDGDRKLSRRRPRQRRSVVL